MDMSPYKDPKDKQAYNKRYYFRKRAETIKALGGKCEGCGCFFNLEIHHDKPVGHQGNRHILWGDLKNLRLFCHDCHVAYHRKHGGRHPRP